MWVDTILSGINTVIAAISGTVHNKQALLEKRILFLDDYDKYVNQILPSWEWDGNTDLIDKHSETETHALFGKQFVYLRNEILTTAEKTNMLIGDIDYARQHGACNGRADFEIEEEKLALEARLQDYFSDMKELAKEKKWL